MRTHVVKSGETLGRIARRYDVPLDSIVRLNGIANPDRIRVGQRLSIPEVTTDGMDLEPAPREEPPPRPEPGEPLRVNRTRFRLPAKEYYPEVQPKDLIVLHFTAGRTAKSAYQTWLDQPAHVATAYIVDPDGRVYETFDPAHWAFHLGVKGTHGKHDKRSIAIEIANPGPLRPHPTDPSRLNWWPRDFGAKWCHRDEIDRYVEAPYRGMHFFAAMPDPQQDAVARLVGQLCDTFGIERRIPGRRRRTECDLTTFAGYRGIAAHQNFRTDKWDVGPAFDWERLGV